MKLRDAIQYVDRSPENTWEASLSTFGKIFSLYHFSDDASDKFDARVKYHYLVKWYCTDSWVGLRVYYMDDEPIAVSMQNGRKSAEELEFISLEAAKKVHEFTISLLIDEKVGEEYPLISNLDEEFGETYGVAYSSQLLVKTGIYQGRVVRVVREYDSRDPTNMWTKVDIEDNGITKTIDMSEFEIPLHVKKPT